MSCIQTNILAGASGQGTTGYEIERSLRFNSADSAYLNRTPSSAGNLKLWTWSGWVKRPDGGSDKRGLFGVNNTNAMIRFNNDDGGSNLRVLDNATGGYDVITKAKYRDPSAWYHFVVSLDTTELTAADRVKIYVNGVRENTFFSASYPTQNQNLTINTAAQHNIGRTGSTNNEYLNAYLADVHFIDGQALAPTNFGETDANGVWNPKAYTGAYGTNGFHLPFSDNSSNAALGTDTSGNNNTWTVNNLVATSGFETANQGFDCRANLTGQFTVNDLNFQPDLIVAKSTSNSEYWIWTDSVRGFDKVLKSNTPDAENSGSAAVTGVGSSGFSSSSNWFTTGRTYSTWCWKAGGAASSNTYGTITSSVSANQAYGFSVVSYNGDNNAGDTVGHGLGSVPKWILVKNRDAAFNWYVYHHELGGTKYLRLDSTGANVTGSGAWNNTAPTSTVFSLGQDNNVNDGNKNYIAYCWSEISGFSNFGSYTGNGSSTGPVITTGFKPKFVMVKASSIAGEDWVFMDTARAPSNPSTYLLSPNIADTQYNSSVYSVDFLDNGFQIKNNNPRWNQNGATYIYAAFADKPDGSIIDSLVDTPTNAAEPTDTGAGGEVKGNYCTWNPLDNAGTLTNGNLDFSQASAAYGNVRSTFAVSSGKWFWEGTVGALGGAAYIGIGKATASLTVNIGGADTWGYTSAGTKGAVNTPAVSYGASYTTGDIIGVAFDADNGTLTFYKNGVSQGSAYSNLISTYGSGPYFFMVTGYNGTTWSANFGQRAFAYTAPSGYKSLNTANLPTPTIADGSTAFNGVTYTGDGNSPRDITGYSFSPDLVWYKQRDSARDHQLYDIVRGAGTDKSLATNTTYAENANDDELYGYLSAFNSDGFEVTTGSTNYNYNNNSGSTYVAWAWDAGSSNTTIAAGELNSSLYDQSRTWSGDLSASNLASPTLMFDWTYGYGTYTGTCTWTTTNAAYSNLSGRVYLANNTTVTLGITFKDSNGTTLGTFNLPWTGNGTQMQDTGFDWSSSVATVEITGNYLPVRVQIGSKTIVDTGVTVSNVPSIASTVRANPSAGFSIVGWSGQAGTNTVGHGLNAAPELIILKDRTNAGAWVVGSDYIGWGNRLELNTTAAASSASADFNSTAPTASVFTVGSNQSSGNKIAYCFAPVEGYSAMGNYTGNGSTDGPFMYTGFRPAFLLIKNSSLAGSNWIIIDTARDTFNEADHLLKSNVSDAEQITTANEVDILSNGFKPRGTDGDTNGNGNTLVYAAFAEHPFKTARAR